MPQKTLDQDALQQSPNMFVSLHKPHNFTLEKPDQTSDLNKAFQDDKDRGNISLGENLSEKEIEKIKKNYTQVLTGLGLSFITGGIAPPNSLAGHIKGTAHFYKQNGKIYADTTVKDIKVGYKEVIHEIPGQVKQTFQLTEEGFKLTTTNTSNSLLAELISGNMNVSVNENSIRVAEKEERQNTLENLGQNNPTISLQDAEKIIKQYKEEYRGLGRKLSGMLFQNRDGLTRTLHQLEKAVIYTKISELNVVYFKTFSSIITQRDTRKKLTGENTSILSIMNNENPKTLSATEKTIDRFTKAFEKSLHPKKKVDERADHERKDKQTDKEEEQRQLSGPMPGG